MNRRTLIKSTPFGAVAIIAAISELRNPVMAARRPTPTPKPTVTAIPTSPPVTTTPVPPTATPTTPAGFCPETRPFRCNPGTGPTCCTLPEQCCDNACCNAGTYCAAEEICCPYGTHWNGVNACVV